MVYIRVTNKEGKMGHLDFRGVSFRYKLYTAGDSTNPCGTPASFSHCLIMVAENCITSRGAM